MAGPIAQLRHHGLQRMALVGELVAHPHPAPGLHLALDEAGLLELLEAARQKTVGHAGHGLLELCEVKRAVGQRVEDGPGPAAADQLHRAVVMPTDLSWLGLPPGRANAGLSSHCTSSLPIVR